MRKFTWKRSRKAGLPPGTMVHIGERKLEKTRIGVIDYDQVRFEEKEAVSVEECFAYKDKESVTWINVEGIHDVDVLRMLGEGFGLHPLTMEDILNTDQRPKLDDYGEYLFIVLKMFHYDDVENEILAEQVSLIVGRGFVISFQESGGDVFNPVRDRIRNNKGRVRMMGADYLAYALMDSVVDGYFLIMEKFGGNIEVLEDELISDPGPGTLEELHILKRELIFFRRSVWPLREVVRGLETGASSLIQEGTGIFLRDVYDHAIQVIETVETFREMLSGMLDIYLSNVSNRMNQVMKVLTIIATIFIPLTFIAGIYGMNFRYMPELEWRFGYFVVLVVMAFIGVLMVIYFRMKRWL
jgi:magnesium transporter